MEERKSWYICPLCGKKIAIYKERAKCSKVFVICRGCRKEIEIKID